MKLYLLLLTMLIGSNCDESDNVVDIGETVKEVESLLAEDPKLPRLTRGEIISLIEEVRNGKDLMVVLPQQFNATLEEMYTAKPVTQIIYDNNGPPKTTKRPKRRRKPIRPVYVHTSTVKAETSSTESTSTKISISEEEWQPKLYITPQGSQPTITAATTIRTTTETEPVIKPDISAAAESLSPDMKELLSSFGLLNNGSPIKTTIEPPSFMLKSISPTVDPSSYSRFKPLPSVSEVMSPDMKSFLAAYGLLDIREAKSHQITPQSDPLEHLPYKDILEDLGLRKSKKLNHVFNPNSIKNSTEELHKVNKILMKLREFSEGNVTTLNQDELNELIQLENNTRTFNENADDQITLESLKTKIDVKRQQPNDTDNIETTTISDISTDITTITTVDNNTTTIVETTESSASAAELEESFGGSETSSRRPNGFYFLLDWNSFLDVGLENRQVNLNFSPKVGDPRNFLPVNVP